MPSQLKLKNLGYVKKQRKWRKKMKAMSKVTLTLGLMIIVSLFLTSYSSVVTPELQLDLGEDINTVTPETAIGNLENQEDINQNGNNSQSSSTEPVEEPAEEPGTVYPQKWATGDGTVENPWANDCIQKAYAACPTGGTIYLRAGYYELADEFTMTKSINIIGEGIQRTFVISADDYAIFIDTADYVTIKDMTIDGDAQGDGDNYKSCVYIENSDYTLLENLEVKNAGYYGISLYQVNYSICQNIYAHDNYRHGLHPGSDAAGRNKWNVYRDIYAWDNGVCGFNDRGSEADPDVESYNVFDNLQCWDNGSHGIIIGNQKGFTLSNSSANGNTGVGIYIFASEDSNIHDCFATFNGKEGLRIYDSSKSINVTNVITKNNNCAEADNKS